MTPDITYSVRYPDFMLGLQFAMQHAIARVCEAYHDDMPQDSVFRSFGRRVVGGNVVGPEVLGDDPHMEDVQVQALEQNMVDMRKSLYNEMTRADITEDQVGILNGQLAQKETEVNHRGDVILNMHEIIEQIMYEKNLLQLMYDQLQAQVTSSNRTCTCPYTCTTTSSATPSGRGDGATGGGASGGIGDEHTYHQHPFPVHGFCS